jgi:selenocysteine-specific elongation factor
MKRDRQACKHYLNIMKSIILGTAGHIDHGKTTLIKVLTGVDCDRLKEEKLRGITIELGFASLTLPSGQKAGIVDVPGHEKFIKNMVAGVGGIDGVMLVIAADEGVMPQTREHLDICRLLSIKKGIVILTKTDLVDEDWISLVTEDIKGSVKDSFLDGAPIIPVSSATRSGIEDLLSALENLVAGIDERPPSGVVRLPVDRVFSMKGFGTVVTGTLLAGKISVGDDVEILPEKTKTRIRGVQVHGSHVESATAGLRTALNLQGIEKSSMKRGDVIALPDTIIPSKKVTAWFEHLESSPRPLKNRARVRFHSGTSEILSRAILLNSDELPPGKSDFIQLVLDAPAVLLPHDRYVLRSYSPVDTIGGGEILDNNPLKHKRFADKTLRRLEILKNRDTKEVLLLFCREAGPKGLGFSQIQARCGLEEKRLHAQIDKMLSEGVIVSFSKNPLQITLPDIIAEIEAGISGQLKTYHSLNPLKPGLLKEELRTGLPRGTDPKLYSFVVENLVKKEKIKTTKEFMSLSEHKPVLKNSQKDLKNKILTLYKKGGSTPPTRRELIEKLRVQDSEAASILNLLVREGSLIKLNEDLFYEAQALNGIIQKTIAHMEKSGELTIKDFKELTGLSRKFIIPVIEYLDKSKITLRMGDIRVLRKPGS